MEIVSAAGDTAADILAVVLEIHNKYRLARFAVTHFFHKIVHIFALHGRWDKLFIGVVPDGHIVEIKRVFNAEVNHFVKKSVVRYSLNIFSCVANGNDEKNFFAL